MRALQFGVAIGLFALVSACGGGGSSSGGSTVNPTPDVTFDQRVFTGTYTTNIYSGELTIRRDGEGGATLQISGFPCIGPNQIIVGLSDSYDNQSNKGKIQVSPITFASGAMLGSRSGFDIDYGETNGTFALDPDLQTCLGVTGTTTSS